MFVNIFEKAGAWFVISGKVWVLREKGRVLFIIKFIQRKICL